MYKRIYKPAPGDLPRNIMTYKQYQKDAIKRGVNIEEDFKKIRFANKISQYEKERL